jgi:hypothetical protein
VWTVHIGILAITPGWTDQRTDPAIASTGHETNPEHRDQDNLLRAILGSLATDTPLAEGSPGYAITLV